MMFWGGKSADGAAREDEKGGGENCAANILARRMLFRASCD